MDEQSAAPDKKRLLLSMLIPFIFISLMWLVRAIEVIFDIDLYFLGIYPLKASSLTGIITSPFIHADIKHLFNNTIPLFVLGTALFYFYSQVSFRVLLWLFLLTGLSVWVTGRPSWHIGASGIIYGLASFLFVSGIITAPYSAHGSFPAGGIPLRRNGMGRIPRVQDRYLVGIAYAWRRRWTVPCSMVSC